MSLYFKSPLLFYSAALFPLLGFLFDPPLLICNSTYFLPLINFSITPSICMIWYILFYLLLVWFTSNHQYYVIQWHIRLIFSLPSHRLYEWNHSCDVVFLKWPQCYNLCSFLRTLTHPICNCTYYLLSVAYELLFLILTTLLLIAGGGGRFKNDGNKGVNLWPCYCYLSLWTSLS